jgi:Integrase zinc binding domain
MFEKTSSAQEIIESQRKSSETRPRGFVQVDGCICDGKDIFWVPQEPADLRLRIIIAAHAAHGGHRGVQATLRSLSTEFYWTTLDADVQAFVSSCLHCLATGG